MKKLSLLFALCSFALTGFAEEDCCTTPERDMIVSVQPLRFFTRTFSASYEQQLTPTISYWIPLLLSVYYTSPWNEQPGWQSFVQTGFEAKFHVIGEAIKGGFYLIPGITFGYERYPNAYELRLLYYTLQSQNTSFHFNQAYLQDVDFLMLDVLFAIGYDHTFDTTGIFLDVRLGLAASTVFSVGKQSGWFYTMPTPVFDFSVGYSFS